MNIYQKAIEKYKKEFEQAITSGKNIKGENVGGLKAKESFIRSSKLINYIHDAVKEDLINNGINNDLIFPPLHETKPEIKLAGFLKQKNQDVTVVPYDLSPVSTKINWGPLEYENIYDKYGKDYSEKCLVINIRSQMSSLAKNCDTLFERTFAEALNLHLVYPKIVLGEFYIIPLKEYDDNLIKKNKIGFKNNVNVKKYISFFNSINSRLDEESLYYKYERCCLMIVDFSQTPIKIYESQEELINDKIIPKNFDINYDALNYLDFINDLITEHNKRFNII